VGARHGWGGKGEALASKNRTGHRAALASHQASRPLKPIMLINTLLENARRILAVTRMASRARPLDKRVAGIIGSRTEAICGLKPTKAAPSGHAQVPRSGAHQTSWAGTAVGTGSLGGK